MQLGKGGTGVGRRDHADGIPGGVFIGREQHAQPLSAGKGDHLLLLVCLHYNANSLVG